MRQKDLPDLVLDLIHVARAIDQHNPAGFACGQLPITFANLFVKLRRLLLHPVRLARFLHSFLSRRSINVEYKGNVRDAIARSERIETIDHRAIQSSRGALVNGRGIKETVGDNADAAFQRRIDYLAHKLAATSLKEEQLSLGRHS